MSAAVLSTTAYAKDQAYEDSFISKVNWQIEPYIGADAMTRVMRYKDEPTHPFQEHLDTFQPFVGLRLHKYFGVEAGYQQSEKGTKERFFHPNETPEFFGGGPMRLEDPGIWFTRLDINTTTAIKGWNFSLMGFYPIFKDKTELFAKVGYSDLDLDTEYRIDGRMGDPANLIASRADFDYGHLHDGTGMLHLGLGVKHAFSHNIGGRVFVNYDRTVRLDLDSRTLLFDQLNEAAVNGFVGADVNRSGSINIKPHSSWCFGVGLYYTWR